MSEISAGLKKTINEIKRLSDGSMDDQIKASELMTEKIFPFYKLKTGIPVSVIPELLPIIIKFMESNDHVLQEEGAGFIIDITCTPDKKANTKLVIDAGVIPKLKNLLSSTNSYVLISTLVALINIAYHFPEKIIEYGILPTIIECLKSDDKLVSQYSAWIMENISDKSGERIAAIFEVNGFQPIIKILESKEYDAIECALEALLNITSCNEQYCQRVIDYGGLKSLKKLCDRLFAVKKPKRSNIKIDKSKQKKEKLLKKLVVKFIKIVTSYGEAQIDLIIKENFVPFILQQIKCGMTPEIKIESIKVIQNVIAAKCDLIPSFIDDHNIISLLYNNLRSTNADLIITSLTAMRNIVELFEDRDSIRRKLRECGNQTKLTNLFQHSNEEIRQLSTMLYEFVFDVKPVPIVGVSAENNEQAHEVIELDSEDDDTPAVETPQTGRKRKRQADTPNNGPLRRSKRFKVSLEQTYSYSDSSSDDDSENDNDQNNDFDDHPTSSSSAGAAPIESNRNDHSRRQSSVGEDTVSTDGPSRFHPKAEPQPTPQNVDIPATSASHQSPELPVTASTNNEREQDEMKPSVVGRLANRLRRASNHSHVKPEPASTNDGNIRLTPKAEPTPQNVYIPATRASRQLPDLPVAASTHNETAHNNHAGRQITVNSETAATADGIVRNSSAIAPALPVDSASAIFGTIPNDIPSRKPSPVPQAVITLTLANQVTPPDAVATANNDDIIRDEIIKYWHPAEFLIHQFCETLEIQFSRDNYVEFISKIKFIQITSNSKPSNIYQPIDQSGFGCFSILLTGNEDSSSKIRDKINRKFIDFMDTFDKEKIKDVTLSPIMLAEHLETIATWLKCQILVYFNGWKKYGNWKTEDQMIPLFVLEKKEIDGKTEYCIVLTLKNERML